MCAYLRSITPEKMATGSSSFVQGLSPPLRFMLWVYVFSCMYVSGTCISQKRDTLGLRVVLSHHGGNESWTRVLCKSNKAFNHWGIFLAPPLLFTPQNKIGDREALLSPWTWCYGLSTTAGQLLAQYKTPGTTATKQSSRKTSGGTGVRHIGPVFRNIIKSTSVLFWAQKDQLP